MYIIIITRSLSISRDGRVARLKVNSRQDISLDKTLQPIELFRSCQQHLCQQYLIQPL